MYKKTFTLLGLVALLGVQAMAQKADTTKTHLLQEVQVSTTRASEMTALTTTTLSKEELDERKTSLNVPRMLEMEPSVVADGEQGIVGNTSMRIRGVDAARINVNINGITLNDPESQSVFWVNIPNLAGMAQSMQIQRGVTAAMGGSAAMGAAINLSTLNPSMQPYAQADMGIGSWNTRQYGVMAGTGLMKGGFAIDLAYNGMTSDGYIRNGFCDHQSLFLSASRYGEKSLLKALVILGKQKTGITWNGAYADDLDLDPTYNDAGTYYDALGNAYYYGNETDNYYQRHYQLYYTYVPSSQWVVNAAADYTPGDGYYENYKDDKKPGKYGLTGDDEALSKSDYIVRKAMHNHAFTLLANARYTKDKMRLSFGANGLRFIGDHFGNLQWAQDMAHLSANGVALADCLDTYEFYRNQGNKTDITGFARLDYDFSRTMNAYLDLQYRLVNYTIEGTDDDYGTLAYNGSFPFFNPKAGWNWLINRHHRLYAVAGISGREPTRADIKDAVSNGIDIRGERMLDIEIGHQYTSRHFETSLNAYAMLYKDQLTATGAISSSGYAFMENVDKSYRLGLEMQAGYMPLQWMKVEGNLTLSTNKIIDYIYSYDVYDNGNDWNWLGTEQENLGTTNLSFSPSVVGAGVVTFMPVENLKLQLIAKYVGEMYVDNTSREEMLQDDYFLLNARAAYTWRLPAGNEVEASFVVNNILNHTYRTNAWNSYALFQDGYNGMSRAYFQQPGINWAARLAIRL